jgi:hypothetical protein
VSRSTVEQRLPNDERSPSSVGLGLELHRYLDATARTRRREHGYVRGA